WLALPGSLVALTLSTGVASGVEGGVHIGMLPARLGWALLPLLALVLIRWADDEGSRPWGLALISLAAIVVTHPAHVPAAAVLVLDDRRSEEHTSELQSRGHLVCRLLLEKKKNRCSFTTYSSTSSADKKQ